MEAPSIIFWPPCAHAHVHTCIYRCEHTLHILHTQSSKCILFWVSPLTFLWGFACSAAVGVGFYGNSETNDGVHQLIYSLDNANHTFSGMDELVRIVGRWLGTGTAHEISKAGTRVPVRSQEPSCTLSSCVMDFVGRAAF